MMNAKSASSSVTGRRLRISGPTSTRFWNDLPKSPRHRLAQPFHVLDVKRAVEPVQRFEAHDRLRRRVDAERRARGRSRHDVDGDEQDERRREKGRHEQRKPREDEADHRMTKTGEGAASPAGAVQLSNHESFSVFRNPVRSGMKPCSFLSWAMRM